MASSSSAFKEMNNITNQQQVQNSVSHYRIDGRYVHGSGWSREEQIILEECLAKYATKATVICYSKIAAHLKNKTARDVALHCRRMTKQEISKKRKEDLTMSARKGKERKKLVIDSSRKPSRLGMQPGSSRGPRPIHNNNNNDDDVIPYNDIDGMTRQLLQQNAWAFEQISANLTTHKVHENIGLLSKTRDNLYQILVNLNQMSPTLKKMAPLPKLDEDMAKSILPPSNHHIQL